MAAQAAGCALASLVLLVFDAALGLSVLLAGIVMLVPGAWFARQITREDAERKLSRYAAQLAKDEAKERQGIAAEFASYGMAKAHLWQAGVRFLATLLLMGIVIVGYEALNPHGFFASLAGLLLMHIAVALWHSVRVKGN